MKAYEYIEKGWTQYAAARDAAGHPIEPEHPAATCWCAYGAIRAAYSGVAIIDAFDRLRKVINGSSAVLHAIHSWNDTASRTRAEVIAALREADV